MNPPPEYRWNLLVLRAIVAWVVVTESCSKSPEASFWAHVWASLIANLIGWGGKIAITLAIVKGAAAFRSEVDNEPGRAELNQISRSHSLPSMQAEKGGEKLNRLSRIVR